MSSVSSFEVTTTPQSPPKELSQLPQTDSSPSPTEQKTNEISVLRIVKKGTREEIETINLSDLHIAVFNGNASVLEKRSKELVKLSFGLGITPAHIAAMAPNSTQVLSILLKENGCDLNAKTKYGLHPIEVAINLENLEALRFYLDTVKVDLLEHTSVCEIAADAPEKVLEFFLKRDHDFSSCNRFDKSPLEIILEERDDGIKKLFNKFGYNIEPN